MEVNAKYVGPFFSRKVCTSLKMFLDLWEALQAIIYIWAYRMDENYIEGYIDFSFSILRKCLRMQPSPIIEPIKLFGAVHVNNDNLY